MKNFLRYILVLICGNIPSHAQIITTVAGNGGFGYSGDGGPATDAMLILPQGISINAYGDIFIWSGGNRVRKVDHITGVITTYAGNGSGIASGDGGPATAAGIVNSWGIEIDVIGNLYIGSSNCIRKVDTAGIVSTFAGTGTTGYSGDGGPATAARFGTVKGVAVDVGGNLYIGDVINHCIRKVNTSGIISTFAGTGIAGYFGDGGPATAAKFNVIEDVAVDILGNVYVAEQGNCCIRKINTSGIISTIAGTGITGFSGDGGPATAAQLSGVKGIEVNGAYIYISDRAPNERIRMIDPAGIITTIAGTGVPGLLGDGGPATAATLFGPHHLVRYGGGNLYFVDRQSSRVRMITMPNSTPYFTHGTIAHLTACGEYNPIDTLLRVMDSNATQPLTWSVVVPPAHGTAFVAYTTTSTGGVLTPTGTGYTPATGYQGPDTFKVRVSDGGAADTITIAVDVQVFPIAAPITGIDTICVGDMTTLTGPTVGGGTGVWSSPHSTVAVGAATGVVTGMATGTATITYTLSNYCGTATATHTVTILPSGDCPTGISSISASKHISIFPNPNTGSFTIELPTGTPSLITITDVMGRKMLELNSTASCPLSLPPGSAGVYFVEVMMGYERWYGKVVVQ
ncbi:MAG: T9SS type A sorting domain-containing protein [Taibaiella sp.]|nr:T9SS type A sorting domain-containing protein [Taibaiella sp.]